ncbi:nitroreductase family protein [Carnobacterium gallinarum]|uniref:nitroreductase family protein n=1 Tax=Carnobacterium gallinarum TaxID=2749 RepID=UPI000558ADF0|nr:nitroreductase family protein [Carnobacterium gallinarum]
MKASISETIVTRRTSKTSLTTEIPVELIYNLLEKASYAPFHGKTEPWLAKIVTTDTEKQWLYQRIIASYERNQIIKDAQSRERMTTKMTRLILNSPATILFAHEVFPDDQRKNYDAIEATAALIQNFSLVAWEEDLVGFWATSPFILDPILTNELGFPLNYELMTNYRLGYRDLEQPIKTAQRQPIHNWATPLVPLAE